MEQGGELGSIFVWIGACCASIVVVADVATCIATYSSSEKCVAALTLTRRFPTP